MYIEKCIPLGALLRGGSQHSIWKPRSQRSQNNILSCKKTLDLNYITLQMKKKKYKLVSTAQNPFKVFKNHTLIILKHNDISTLTINLVSYLSTRFLAERAGFTIDALPSQLFDSFCQFGRKLQARWVTCQKKKIFL